MKELAYETTDKQKKGFYEQIISLNFNRLKDFNSGSECDIGSEKFWLKEVLKSLPIPITLALAFALIFSRT